MPDQSTLDPYAILASLNVTNAEQVEPVSGGYDTAIWKVKWQGVFYALRVFRPEQKLTAEKEIRLMQLAADYQIPVPKVARNGTWQGRPVLLLSWINGQTLGTQLLNHPQLIWQIGSAFGRTQAAIHQIPAPSAMNSTEWIDWAGDEPELKARLYDLPSRKHRLLHLDYHPLNVMAANGQISGVVDWANARAGDPRADFARTYAILRIEPYGPKADDFKLNIGRRLLAYFWQRGYVQAGGQLDEMALFYAWAGASMIRDLSPRIGKPGFWLQDHHLDGVRAWRDQWKRKAGFTI